MKKIILSFLIIGTYSQVYCQQPALVVSDKSGWHKIAETTANFKTDKDEVSVMGADRFAFIKIKITDAPVNLSSFDIYFENGEKQNVLVGEQIKVPGETRVVQLKGGERSIKKIAFLYKTVPSPKDEKARVELWGLKTNPDKKISVSLLSDISKWPEASRNAANEMISKYGLPDATTDDMLVWNNNGIWLKTIVYKVEMKHNFPMAHTDVLEQWINYRVPPDKYDEIALYDGSVTINRTNGTLSARCDKEAMNILALNLAYDIAQNIKTVALARTDYGKNAMAYKNGDRPDYTQNLIFKSDRSAPDPDKALDMDVKDSFGLER